MTGPRDAPGSEVSLGEILEHRLFELCFCYKPFEPRALLLHLGEPFGLFCLQAAVELTQAVVGGLGDLENSPGVCNRLDLGKLLVSCVELAVDLLGRWRVHFMVESPAQSGRILTLIFRGPISENIATPYEFSQNMILTPL